MKNEKHLKGVRLSFDVPDPAGTWKTLTSTICYHIWYGTPNEFAKSNDYQDLEWLLLCGLYICHHWDETVMSEKYSIPDLKKEMDPMVIYFKDRLIVNLPEIKARMDKMRAIIKANPEFNTPDFPDEPSKLFISIFIDELLGKFDKTLNTTDPQLLFQFGIEALLLFTPEIKIKNRKFYDLIKDIGPYETDDAIDVMKYIEEVL